MIQFELENSNDKVVYDSEQNRIFINGIPQTILLNNNSSNKCGIKCSECNKIFYIRIALGSKCNFKCKYCIQSELKNKNEEIDIDKFCNNLISFLEKRNENVKEISFWGGDAFVYFKEVKEIFQKLNKQFKDLKFSIVTNGSLLSKNEIKDWILENKNITIVASFDGPGQYLRGSNFFENKEILKLINVLCKENRFGISSTLTKENSSLKKLKESIEHYLPNYNGQIALEFLYIVDKFSKECSIDNLEKFTENFYNDFFESDNSVFVNTNQTIDNVIENFENLNQKIFCHSISSNTLSLDLNGNILVCQNNYNSNLNINELKEYKIPFFELVKQNTNIFNKWNSFCKDCFVKYICNGGCPNLNLKYDEFNCEILKEKSILILMIIVTLITNKRVTKLFRLNS